MTSRLRSTSDLARVAFRQVDVFTGTPFQGNPVAVILEGDALTGTQMQQIAAWTRLSETAFLCTPRHHEADYRLRIFTPGEEIPFAGHPTIGSAWAFLQDGRRPKTPGRLVQECGKGLIALRQAGERLFCALPDPRILAADESERLAVANALGLRPDEIGVHALVDVGPVWFTVQLASAGKVLTLKPRAALMETLADARYDGITVFGLHPPGTTEALEVRSVAPRLGVPEDPVCGSGNGCVAALVRQHRLLASSHYTASQGACLSRSGRVAIEYDPDGTIWVGGLAVTCIEGSLAVDRKR